LKVLLGELNWRNDVILMDEIGLCKLIEAVDMYW
jgi:hypothetical protein